MLRPKEGSYRVKLRHNAAEFEKADRKYKKDLNKYIDHIEDELERYKQIDKLTSCGRNTPKEECDYLVSYASLYFGVKERELTSKSRKGELIKVRGLLYFLLRFVVLKFKLIQVASVFGRKHPGVATATKTFLRDYLSDEKYKKKCDGLVHEVYGKDVLRKFHVLIKVKISEWDV